MLRYPLKINNKVQTSPAPSPEGRRLVWLDAALPSRAVGGDGARVAHCLLCFSLSMWWHSLSAGPSFSPMYFMMMSLRSNISALPSISCREGRRRGHSRTLVLERLCAAAAGGSILTCLRKSSMCGPRVWGSASCTNRMTSSTDQEVTSLPEPSLSCFKWSGPVVELAAVCLTEEIEDR